MARGTLQGRNRTGEQDFLSLWKESSPGDYWLVKDNGRKGAVKGDALWFRLPNGQLGHILRKHEVDDGRQRWDITENPDGTITVSPSIWLQAPGNPDAEWHGYLEKGVWRSV